MKTDKIFRIFQNAPGLGIIIASLISLFFLIFMFSGFPINQPLQQSTQPPFPDVRENKKLEEDLKRINEIQATLEEANSRLENTVSNVRETDNELHEIGDKLKEFDKRLEKVQNDFQKMNNSIYDKVLEVKRLVDERSEEKKKEKKE